MTQWFVELAGGVSDLDNLMSLAHRSPQAQVVREAGGYVLKSDRFMSLTTPSDVDTAAQALLDGLNVAGTILYEHHQAPSIVRVYGVEADGSRSVLQRVHEASAGVVALIGRAEGKGSASGTLSEQVIAEYGRDELLVPETRLYLATFSPTIAVLARFLDGRIDLDKLTWREFEQLLGDLLEANGYDVTLGPGRKDGGVDLLATKDLGEHGKFTAIWQAKKLGPARKVEVGVVRELAFTRDDLKASKGMIATTTYLTRGALDLVRRQECALGKVERDDLLAWIERTVQRRRC